MLKRFAAVLLLVSGMSVAAPAFAGELITGAKPERILAVAKKFGPVKLDKDKEGDPKLSCRVDDTKYAVLFFGCSGGRNCNAIELVAGWSGKKVTLETVNRWNIKKRFAKAFLDTDNDPMLHLDVNLSSGVSEQNLEDTFKKWIRLLDQFEAELANN